MTEPIAIVATIWDTRTMSLLLLRAHWDCMAVLSPILGPHHDSRVGPRWR